MVAEIGFSELLSPAQTIGIVGTMVLTLFFEEANTGSVDGPGNKGSK